MKKTIFISWERHQRTRSFCKKLKIPLEEVLTTKKGISRYSECCIRTFKLIKKHNPKTLLIQNPSIVLAAFALTLKPFFGYKLIVDAHNEAIVPFNLNNILVRIIARLLMRWSDLTLVTNDSLANIVIQNGGKAFILPDFLPALEFKPVTLELNQKLPLHATLICTYAQDEPYLEVFKAARLLGDKLQLNITGKIPRSLDNKLVPPNVKLTGYLAEEDYWETLNNSHLIIDLTNMDDCLVCGAYEAIALKKPLLLSNNSASRKLFGYYAHHTQNIANAIANEITQVIDDYQSLAKKIELATNQFKLAEDERITGFLKELNHE